MSKQIDQSEENDSKDVHKKVLPNLQGQKNVLKQKTLTSFMRKKNETENEADASVSAITRNIVKQTENSVKAQNISSNITTLRAAEESLVGFTNWKTAIEVGKGFSRHELSEMHLTAASRKAEKTKRIETDTSISTLVTSTVLLKRRYYFKAIVKTILFLVEHHLALRGNWDKEYHEEDGLFNSLFDFAKERDPDLVECEKFMPSNAKYTSPEIQNEIIDILAELLRESIVREVLNADVNFFTILFDGTKDRNGDEIVSLAARFVSSGKPVEVLLFFETTEDAMRILSQCYDGASVMNGYKSGVAKRLQDVLKKIIPYVHCFNHRLHLVIIHVVKQIQAVKEFFDQLQLIYTMLKKPKIKKIHEGKSMKRLIDTRWTGHKDAAKAILQNYYEFVDTFKLAVKNISKEIDGEDIAICTGILAVITRKTFVFILVCINEILSFLAPADVIFQKREIGYKRVMPVVESVKTCILELRNDKRSTLLDDFTVEETIGERSGEEEIIDVTIAELEARFSENNSILLALSNADSMDISELKPLETVGIELPSQCELNVAKKYVDRKRADHEKSNAARMVKGGKEKDLSRFNILETLYDAQEPFRNVYNLFATIETFACSTSVCECSFSSLSLVDLPNRLTMTNLRLRNLAFLGFESKRLRNTDLDEVLKKFNSSKRRKVQLY
ncbi:Zinc finger MYM-type protein 1 [Pseudolycoriella hygida]|uniref:Zinc finger MYM-type protein 1 n=1 Tax=Pseudolycoriella hygida TaxID=35572 RepID=A0A9Q0N7Z7_9DIPT|nr:Zinc finger MYM-type protein 1 [Pseudolycoriella hygida]